MASVFTKVPEYSINYIISNRNNQSTWQRLVNIDLRIKSNKMMNPCQIFLSGEIFESRSLNSPTKLTNKVDSQDTRAWLGNVFNQKQSYQNRKMRFLRDWVWNFIFFLKKNIFHHWITETNSLTVYLKFFLRTWDKHSR